MSNREDDGGQQWFDAKMRQRINERVQIKQGVQQNNRDGKSYLDRKVGGVQQNQAAEITDPYIRKLIEGRQQQQFFGPAHLGGKVVDKTTAGNYEIDVDMGAMEQSIPRIRCRRSRYGSPVWWQYQHTKQSPTSPIAGNASTRPNESTPSATTRATDSDPAGRISSLSLHSAVVW